MSRYLWLVMHPWAQAVAVSFCLAATVVAYLLLGAT